MFPKKPKHHIHTKLREDQKWKHEAKSDPNEICNPNQGPRNRQVSSSSGKSSGQTGLLRIIPFQHQPMSGGIATFTIIIIITIMN
jgi:hypothetical protein